MQGKSYTCRNHTLNFGCKYAQSQRCRVNTDKNGKDNTPCEVPHHLFFLLTCLLDGVALGEVETGALEAMGVRGVETGVRAAEGVRALRVHGIPAP